MIPKLDDLLNDNRLARLFSSKTGYCALQLWILQVKTGQSIENRIIYGRLLPYSFANNSWSARDDDNFLSFGHFKAQTVQVNLYVESNRCAELLRLLSAGQTISAISEELKLVLTDKLQTRFGATALAAEHLVYRPVSYLLNRDAHDRRSPSSPHGGAGALSASITHTDKGALFDLGQHYDVALVKSVVDYLNARTGLDFGGADTKRLGDLELMVFPALDEREKPLLTVDWTDTPHGIVARFNSAQVPSFNAFQFHLSISNDNEIIHSCIAKAERDEEGWFQYNFELSESLRARTDSTELNIFGLDGDYANQSTLCCRWKINYIREVNIETHAMTNKTQPVEFHWLDKATRSSEATRVKAALTINRNDLQPTSLLSDRQADPWVPANHNFSSLFARLHPPKSNGRFFQRWSKGDGKGRLEFVEWFKALLYKYEKYQIAIFDPYFEDAGLGLLLICASSKADYVVFRSLPKEAKANNAVRDASDKPTRTGIDNLLANCENNRPRMKELNLRIYGLKEGRLHDRYILIRASDGLPVAGFHLSNSFQKAAENFPLLITPIPADTLLKIEQYNSELVQEAKTTRSDNDTESPSIQLLFDSTALPLESRRYQPLDFFEKALAGDVMSMWAGERSLRNLTGNSLKARMTELGLLQGDSLTLSETVGLHNFLVRRGDSFADFSAVWDILGDILAHSSAGDSDYHKLETEEYFLKFLARFLGESFTRRYDEVNKTLTVIDAQLFQGSVETLLYSSYRTDHFFNFTKYAELSWSEYFAVKFLWRYAPEALLLISEAQMAALPKEAQDTDVIPISLLGQIVSEISLSIEVGINEAQRDGLMHSSNGLLQWMGLNAIERELEKPEGLTSNLELIAALPVWERVRTLGWMVHRAAGNPSTPEIYNALVTELHASMPKQIPANDLRKLVASMLGHMRQLSWAEPWLFQDIIFCLLQNDQININHACKIWIEELVELLGPERDCKPKLFRRTREGRTTNIAAYLFAQSSAKTQHASLNLFKNILRRQQRILQQPLASTSNWTRWNDALVVSMWILSFARWAQYHLRNRGMPHSELEKLSRDASEVAMTKPMDKSRSTNLGDRGELAAFLEQVEKLLVAEGPCVSDPRGLF